MFVMLLECSVFRVLILMCGYLNNEDYVAAQVVLETLNATFFFFTYGLGITATTMIGNEIGADNI